MPDRLPPAAAPRDARRRLPTAAIIAAGAAIAGLVLLSLTAGPAAAQTSMDGWSVDMGARPVPLDPAFVDRQPPDTAAAAEAWSAPGLGDPWSVRLYFGGGAPGYGWYGGGWPYGPYARGSHAFPYGANDPYASPTPYGYWGGAWAGAGVWPYAGFAIGSGN